MKYLWCIPVLLFTALLFCERRYRHIDWPPDAYCGARIESFEGPADPINDALQRCPAGTVQLARGGYFKLWTPIIFPTHPHGLLTLNAGGSWLDSRIMFRFVAQLPGGDPRY